jgi:glycerol-3-phosphate dehydrogenase
VIGGGVNGCGIARDAAGRGLAVILFEQTDLAGSTSSASTKLIHGGLRYLEHFKFRLVRESLVEREVLLKAAPHIVSPMRFVLPLHRGLRPWPVLRLGLFLYDHLGGRAILPPTRSLDLTRDPAGRPLRPEFVRGFEYSDCLVDDSRLVVLNAVDAAAHGAAIHTRTRCVAAERKDQTWRLTALDVDTGTRREVVARALVNAGGPWVSRVMTEVAHLEAPARIRMVKGSHIVVDRLFDHDRAYIFQNADGRICFAIPYEEDFTLIGTTDEDFAGDPDKVTISDGETDYLLEMVSAYLRKPVARDRIRWTYAGVRPLYDDGASKASEATRDYILKLDAPPGAAPIMTVFGGKITTYRRLAEHALEQLQRFFPAMAPPWTAAAPLPGGDFDHDQVAARTSALAHDYPFLPQRTVRRLFRAYGTHAADVLGKARKREDLGQDFGAGLTSREVNYLVENEWAQNSDDVLWRRSKLGLRLLTEERAALSSYMAGLPGLSRGSVRASPLAQGIARGRNS